MIQTWNMVQQQASRIVGNGLRRRLHGLLNAGLRRVAHVLLAATACVVLLAMWRSKLTSPEPTLLLRDRHGAFLAEIRPAPDGELGYWPLEEVPPRVAAATLAIEDRRFWSHPGVDPLAIGRAAYHGVRRRRRVSGASTIAMQIARMQNPGARTYLRKAVEAVTAVCLTARNGREALLRHYLRIVPYGNRIHGIAYAARRYFDKPVEDLSWAETAFLTALPQAPARMNPYSPTGRRRAIQRGKEILSGLREADALTPAELALALQQIERIRIPKRADRPTSAVHAVLRLDAVLGRAGATTPEPMVTTTLDRELQDFVESTARDSVHTWAPLGAGNAAVIVLERDTMEVLAWVGSTGYFDRGHAGAIDYIQTERSPGSTLKSFIYALGLESGTLRSDTVVDDVMRGAGGISNSDDAFLGPMIPRVALANSRNVPATRLLKRLGVPAAYGFLRSLGIHDAVRPASQFGLELAIGGLPTTLERLTRAYGALGDGCLRELRWWKGEAIQAPRRVMSEDTARLITLYLADPMARLPTFPRVGTTEFPFPVAVKTGSSSGYRDGWTVAWSPRYLVGAWVGHPDARPMNGLSGYRSAARLTRAVLLKIHDDETAGLHNLEFAPPRGFVSKRICLRTGRLAISACSEVLLEWFRPGAEPIDDCNVHVIRAIDDRNGLLATAMTPREHVKVQTFGAFAAPYAAWAAGVGIPRPPVDASPLGEDETLVALVEQFVRRALSESSGNPWTRVNATSAQVQELLARLMSRGNIAATMARTRIETPLSAALERARLALDPGGEPRRHMRIQSPEPDARFLRDPETPQELSTVELQAIVDPPVEQVVWYVDGQPFRTVDFPYTTRWELRPGVHTIQARAAFSKDVTPAVQVTVQ